jgi:5-hydroxyisourate hydrolase
MDGYLSTHALDLVLGHGAGRLKVSVRRLPDAHLGDFELDEHGRAVLIPVGQLIPGLYELDFHVGDYHRARGLVDGEAFFEQAPVRFRISDASIHYHIPLLVSLFGYSTYRGG